MDFRNEMLENELTLAVRTCDFFYTKSETIWDDGDNKWHELRLVLDKIDLRVSLLLDDSLLLEVDYLHDFKDFITTPIQELYDEICLEI